MEYNESYNKSYKTSYKTDYETDYEVTISKEVISQYHDRLISLIFKSLTIFEGRDYKTKKVVMSKEEAISQFKDYSSNLILEISGCKQLFNKNPNFVSLLANLVELHGQCNHTQVRKLVFICIGIVEKMKGEL